MKLLLFPEYLPEALQNDCAKCSEAQKRNLKKVVTYLRTHNPRDWQALSAKYDPQGIHQKRSEFGQF